MDTLSRKELVEVLPKCPNIADQLKILTDQFDDFVGKYDKLQSELVISKNCNSLLFNRIINLERNAFSNAHYIRRKMLVINPVPHSINNVDFEEKVYKALPLTGTKVKPEDLDACHRMKKKDKMIIKFKNRKQRNQVIFKQKELKLKGENVLALQFGPSLFTNDSMCLKSQILFYKYRQLKNTGKFF